MVKTNFKSELWSVLKQGVGGWISPYVHKERKEKRIDYD
jgi:hypothetical protein